MSTPIVRKFSVAAGFLPLVGSQLIAIVEISSPPTNLNTIYQKSDDGSADVPWIPGETHVMRRIDLNKLQFKGTAPDFLTIIGGTT